MQLEVSSPEGVSFQGYYKCYDLPAIVVIDPITGSNMKSFQGFQAAERYVLLSPLERLKSKAKMLSAPNLLFFTLSLLKCCSFLSSLTIDKNTHSK